MTLQPENFCIRHTIQNQRFAISLTRISKESCGLARQCYNKEK